jgi:hypothetical protein
MEMFMPAALQGIWNTIANTQHIQQTDPTDRPDHPNHQPAESNQQTGEIRRSSSTDPSVIRPNPSRYFPRGTRLNRDLVGGYAQFVKQRMSDGWTCYLVTFVFDRIPGSRDRVMTRMRDEVLRVYSTLVTRVHRNPRAASTGDLPALLSVADLPVYKRDRSMAPTSFCNGGLHIHALVLMPPMSRMTEGLDEHFRDKSDLYVIPDGSIQRVHVVRVTTEPDRVVDYVFKAVLNRRIPYDEALMVLPRSSGELDSAGSCHEPDAVSVVVR